MDQHFVAGLVTEFVVDGLEIVQVDEAQNTGAADPPGNGQGLAKLLVETPAVEQAGEFVLVGEGFQRCDALITSRPLSDARRVI